MGYLNDYLDYLEYIDEANLDDIVDHFKQHGMKYLLALGGAAGTVASGHHLYKKMKSRQLKHKVLNHLNKHREIYAGAGTGLAASLISSHGKDAGSRAKSAAMSGIVGALGGSIMKNLRDEDRSEYFKK